MAPRAVDSPKQRQAAWNHALDLRVLKRLGRARLTLLTADRAKQLPLRLNARSVEGS